jgi:hypothetical protein
VSEIKSDYFKNRFSLEAKLLFHTINDLASSGFGSSTVYPIYRKFLPIKSFEVYCQELVELLDKTQYNGCLQYSSTDNNLCILYIDEEKKNLPLKPDTAYDPRIPNHLKHLFW